MFFTLAELPTLGTEVKLGVIGNPIAHSKSPLMQQAALNEAGMPWKYVRLLADTSDGAFEQLLEQLAARGFIGVNVTVPFKKKAFAAARTADALSTLCGASNTLRLRPDGGWDAFNTDGPGFSTAISELCGRSLNELHIVILGACGGAGSALAATCVLNKSRSLTLVNRPRPELERLAVALSPHSNTPLISCHFNTPELQKAIEQADLVVNATSLGLREGDPLPLSPEWLHPGQIVYDIVTHDTPLRRVAAECGCTTDNGLGMLLWQGAEAFRHWFGQAPSAPHMREALLRA